MNRILVTLSLIVLMSLGAHASELGRDLFLGHSKTQSTATIAGGATTVPARLFGCAGCHGRDGRGGVEGGTIIPPIDATYLAKPTAQRPGYAMDDFAAAVKDGRAPGGRLLDTSMPRYDFTADEVSALKAYLDRIGEVQLRGVTGTEVRLGLPFFDASDEVASKSHNAFLEAWTRLGSPQPFGRILKLVPIVMKGSADGWDATIDAADVLAIVFPPHGSAKRLLPKAAHLGLPVLFPLAPLEGTEDPLDVRSLFASRREQHNALREVAGREVPILVSTNDIDSDNTKTSLSGHPTIRLSPSDRPPSEIIFAGDESTLNVLMKMDLRQRKVLALVDDVGPALTGLRGAGAELWLADARFVRAVGSSGQSDLNRHASAAADVLLSALLVAGRDLTRAALMRAFSRVRVRRPDWHALDFSRYPLCGTDQVTIVRPN